MQSSVCDVEQGWCVRGYPPARLYRHTGAAPSEDNAEGLCTDKVGLNSMLHECSSSNVLAIWVKQLLQRSYCSLLLALQCAVGGSLASMRE